MIYSFSALTLLGGGHEEQNISHQQSPKVQLQIPSGTQPSL